MKNSLRPIILLLFVFILVLACTKVVNLKTEVEFSVAERHIAEGQINEDLSTVITVVPEEILKEFSYSYSYSVLHGEGHFRDDKGNIIPQNKDTPFNSLSAPLVYVGPDAGEHTVKITVTDNYGFTEKIEIGYTLSEMPSVVWAATSPVKRIELGNGAEIDVTFEKSDAATTTYPSHQPHIVDQPNYTYFT